MAVSGAAGPAFTVSVQRDDRGVATAKRWAFNLFQLVGTLLGNLLDGVEWGPKWAVVLTRQADGASRVLRSFGREGSDRAAAVALADRVAASIDELGVERVADDHGVPRSFIGEVPGT